MKNDTADNIPHNNSIFHIFSHVHLLSEEIQKICKKSEKDNDKKWIATKNGKEVMRGSTASKTAGFYEICNLD